MLVLKSGRRIRRAAMKEKEDDHLTSHIGPLETTEKLIRGHSVTIENLESSRKKALDVLHAAETELDNCVEKSKSSLLQCQQQEALLVDLSKNAKENTTAAESMVESLQELKSKNKERIDALLAINLMVDGTDTQLKQSADLIRKVVFSIEQPEQAKLLYDETQCRTVSDGVGFGVEVGGGVFDSSKIVNVPFVGFGKAPVNGPSSPTVTSSSSSSPQPVTPLHVDPASAGLLPGPYGELWDEPKRDWLLYCLKNNIAVAGPNYGSASRWRKFREEFNEQFFKKNVGFWYQDNALKAQIKNYRRIGERYLEYCESMDKYKESIDAYHQLGDDEKITVVKPRKPKRPDCEVFSGECGLIFGTMYPAYLRAQEDGTLSTSSTSADHGPPIKKNKTPTRMSKKH